MKSNLYDYIDENNITLLSDNIPLPNMKGLYLDNMIVIDKSIDTEAERICVLAEEIGHHETTYGNILNPSVISNIKFEKRARRWAYGNLIHVDDLILSYKSGCRNLFEVSEYLGVTECFLSDALSCMCDIYGSFLVVDRYVVFFSPLGILEKFD